MPILIAVSGILLLLILILGLKMNSFISLVITSVFVGLLAGMDLRMLLLSIQKGAGETMGGIALTLGFSAILGKLLADSGAAQKISSVLIQSFGEKRIRWAMILTGFIVGLPMFYTAAFVVLIPLVFAVAISSKLSPLYIGIPTAASLSVMHGFLPPHPGPSSLAVIFHANIGLTMLYGIIIGIPAMILSGIVFSNFFRTSEAGSLALSEFKAEAVKELPAFPISLLASVMPALIIGFSSLALIVLPETSSLNPIFTFIAEPLISILLSVLFAIVALGLFRGNSMKEIGGLVSDSISGIAMILLIIAAGGAFKQVLIDSKTAAYIALKMKDASISPLFLGWLIAACIRVALGSATVAALTTAGIILPFISNHHISPELMILAIGSGSLMFSHVNDAGFWLFKEYFRLSVSQTILSWSLMETIVSITGLAGVMVLHFLTNA
ncbi:MAG: gluconate:H+ symporter [Cytophagaceae bacterium]